MKEVKYICDTCGKKHEFPEDIDNEIIASFGTWKEVCAVCADKINQFIQSLEK